MAKVVLVWTGLGRIGSGGSSLALGPAVSAPHAGAQGCSHLSSLSFEKLGYWLAPAPSCGLPGVRTHPGLGGGLSSSATQAQGSMGETFREEAWSCSF